MPNKINSLGINAINHQPSTGPHQYIIRVVIQKPMRVRSVHGVHEFLGESLVVFYIGHVVCPGNVFAIYFGAGCVRRGLYCG